MPKERSPGQTSVSISLSSDVLAKIDAQAAALGLSRSAYLSLLAHHHVPIPGSPLSAAAASQPEKAPDLTAKVYDFLLIAVPALEQYAASVENGGDPPPGAPIVEIPSDLAETKLWRFFLLEMDEILRHKYLRSKELGYNIGLSAAIREWLQMHRALWVAAQKLED